MPVFISPNKYCAYNVGMELYGQKVIYQRLDGTTHIFNLLTDGTEYEVEDENILETNLEDALDILASDSAKWLFIESAADCQQVAIRNAGGWIPWNGSSSASGSGSGSGSGSESNNSRSTISTLPFRRKRGTRKSKRKSTRKLRKRA